jgi:O-antigen ligase
MRLLLITLIAFMMLSSALGVDPSSIPGFTLKNVLLYLMVLVLMLRSTMDKSFRVQLPAIPITHAVLIVWSIASYLAVVLVIQYENYNVVKNGLMLKGMVDQLFFFLVFFYGLRNEKECLFVLKFMMISWAASHVIALLDAVGIMQIGDVDTREDGRVQGVTGESNQYGALVAMTLPGLIAAILTTRGKYRLMWIVAVIIAGITLVMTVSRGAFVGVFAGGALGMYLFRRYVPGRTLAAWAGGVVAAAILMVVLAVVLGYGDLLYDRVIAATNVSDLSHTSSGRTQFWARAMEAMFDKPITLLTGYGWRSYWTMGFRWSPHNYYINTWFNLGLPGLICALTLLWLPVRTAVSSIPAVAPETRPVVIGYVIATLAFAISTFFVDLFSPWLDFWAYTGIVLRIVVNAREAAHAQPAPVAVPVAAGARRADSFGWSVARR